MVHRISFKHAFDGIVYVLRSQPNFRVHLIALTLVLVASWYFQVTVQELLILILTSMVVIVAEMLNTAIESVTDLITIKFSQHAKIAKDVAAGMVLVAAIMAVVIGCIIFIPYIQEL